MLDQNSTVHVVKNAYIFGVLRFGVFWTLSPLSPASNCVTCGEKDTSMGLPGQLVSIPCLNKDFEANRIRLTPGTGDYFPCEVDPFGKGQSSL